MQIRDPYDTIERRRYRVAVFWVPEQCLNRLWSDLLLFAFIGPI